MLRLIEIAISAAIIAGTAGSASLAAETKTRQMHKATGVKIATPPTVTVVSPTIPVLLTNGECTGLGGKIVDNKVCGAKSQQACKTVDKDGVVRVACIDGVKN